MVGLNSAESILAFGKQKRIVTHVKKKKDCLNSYLDIDNASSKKVYGTEWLPITCTCNIYIIYQPCLSSCFPQLQMNEWTIYLRLIHNMCFRNNDWVICKANQMSVRTVTDMKSGCVISELKLQLRILACFKFQLQLCLMSVKWNFQGWTEHFKWVVKGFWYKSLVTLVHSVNSYSQYCFVRNLQTRDHNCVYLCWVGNFVSKMTMRITKSSEASKSAERRISGPNLAPYQNCLSDRLQVI